MNINGRIWFINPLDLIIALGIVIAVWIILGLCLNFIYGTLIFFLYIIGSIALGIFLMRKRRND